VDTLSRLERTPKVTQPAGQSGIKVATVTLGFGALSARVGLVGLREAPKDRGSSKPTGHELLGPSSVALGLLLLLLATLVQEA
jgi:hypothetical protein